MSEQALTVGDVLFPPGSDAADGDHRALRDLQSRVQKELKSVDPVAVRGALLAKLAATLDDPFIRGLADAWSKYSEIRKYADKEKYPPDNTFLVSLAEHTISWDHHPSIEVVINKIVLGKLDFAVLLAIEVKGIALEIQDARIRRVRSGSWQGSGEVSLEGQRFYRKELKEVTLPGAVDFGEGVAIHA